MILSDDFFKILNAVQAHVSENYSATLTNKEKLAQLKAYIEKYLKDTNLKMDGISIEELIEILYSEMAEYSILTKYLSREDIEEINLNAWNDLAITYTDGRIEKANEHFNSPQHAVDIIKRLLHHSNMIIDNATPISQGHLPNNTRITAIKEPIVDKDKGISMSIRLLHPSRVTRTQIVSGGNATGSMIDFLCMCLRYGISFLVAGATSSGKTTLLNALLSSVSNEKRIFTIESGTRELSLTKIENGRVVNNVVHTLSRPSDTEAYDISQEDLVVASLRFNPDIVVVGEIRDFEAYSAVEASLTGHTVVSTIHASAADAAHTRLALLCQKKFPINFNTSLMQAAQAFPIVVFEHKLEDNSRRIMDISECVVHPNGEREYRTLYKYTITKNDIVDGKYIIEGHFEQPSIMSEYLKKKLMQFGVPQDVLEKFLIKENECAFK